MNKSFIEYVSLGIIIGIASGLSPGPLLALALSETLEKNIKNGILVSISPIFSDIPVLFLSLYILSRLENLNIFLSLISFFGAIFLFYLGYRNIKAKAKTVKLEKNIKHPFLKGLLINFLSPYTYLFWFFVGAPFIKKGSFVEGVLFVVSYLFGIVFSLICVIFFTEKLKNFLESRFYVYLLKFLGFSFILFGFILLYQSFLYIE